jgi:hypothetical protein
MDAIATAIALSQYAALLTAIGALARLSMLLTLRAFDLWQDSTVGPGQEVG